MHDSDIPREELRATIEARRDLGAEYESALVESFVDKVEAAIAARVRVEVDARLGPAPPAAPYYPPHPPQQRPPADHDALWIALISLGTGIPLTAIAAGVAGFAGLLLAWSCLVVINIAAAFSRRR